MSSATNKSSLLQVSKQGEYQKGFGLLYPPDWRIFKVLNCFVTKVIKILESHAKTTFFRTLQREITLHIMCTVTVIRDSCSN